MRVRDIGCCSRSPAIPPRVDFRLIGEDGRLLLVDLATNWQPFRFPPADGPLVALQIRGNFLPRVQPVISGLGGMNLRQGFARTHGRPCGATNVARIVAYREGRSNSPFCAASSMRVIADIGRLPVFACCRHLVPIASSRQRARTVSRAFLSQEIPMKRINWIVFCVAGLCSLLTADRMPARTPPPDPVLEWIGVMNNTVLAAGTAPNVTGRVVALVSASVFDAVNGIEPRYRPLHVRPNAPPHASQRAAAIQAAYVILMDLYGTQQSAMLNSRRAASLAALAVHENANSIAAGVAWGQTVADAIWTWKLSDGLAPAPPPFFGVQSIAGTPNSLGFWRPTPPANASGATPQLATITPWVLTRPSQFRLPPPLALNNQDYLSDLNEVREMGSLSSTSRSSEQTEVALFWALNTPLAWNRVAAQLSAARGLSLTENAHLFAVLNVTLADAIIACWDSKYRYISWRPVTAIRAGAAPGDPDAAWEPLLDSLTGTPAHPEYPSAHSTYSGAAAFILADAFGENTAFSLTSEIRPGTRSYASFSEAIAEIADARVFGGIHLRSSCASGNSLGRAVADYVSRHAMRERGDDQDDQ